MPTGFPPKDDDQRRGRQPLAHPWNHAEGAGWRHGKTPIPPPKLTKAARDAWTVWMDAWFAWFWTPEDLPGLRQMVRLYDQVERGEFQRHGELRIVMDSYGVTPKGQQDRRWRPHRSEETQSQPAKVLTSQRWAGLKVADGA